MRGYISNNNADNLIEHPWRSGEKIYRTGDLARWLNDGNIEYIGRIDNQVKLRGQRIELGEIESILSKHPDITDNLVVLKKNPAGFHELIAYIFATDIKNFEASRLKSYLKKHLPSYMLPSAFVTISQIPKKENGKKDRKSLQKRNVSERNTYQNIINVDSQYREIKSDNIRIIILFLQILF